MRRCCIDHITVTAPTLDVGAAWVQQALGVAPQMGGEHPRMATHNMLLRLGEALFLEVIAPNPLATPPARPRWFALDTLRPGTEPALATWVARSSDIQVAAAGSTEALGAVEPMQRGALHWLITIPADGGLALQGIAPALIEWQAPDHPAAKLPDLGLSLVQLELLHPEPQRIARLLGSLEMDDSRLCVGQLVDGPPRLVAHIQTPQGLRQLPLPKSGNYVSPRSKLGLAGR